MFFLAMLFDIQFPNDDGTCSTYTDQQSCLKKTNFNREPFCTWQPSTSSGDGICSFAAPHFNFQILLLVAWLQLILSAPVDAFIG